MVHSLTFVTQWVTCFYCVLAASRLLVGVDGPLLVWLLLTAVGALQWKGRRHHTPRRSSHPCQHEWIHEGSEERDICSATGSHTGISTCWLFELGVRSLCAFYGSTLPGKAGYRRDVFNLSVRPFVGLLWNLWARYVVMQSGTSVHGAAAWNDGLMVRRSKVKVTHPRAECRMS